MRISSADMEVPQSVPTYLQANYTIKNLIPLIRAALQVIGSTEHASTM